MSKKTSLAGDALLKLIQQTLDDHKAEEISIIDLEGKTTFAEHMVVASGTSRRHLNALSQYVQEAAKKAGHSYMEVEGSSSEADWVLVDLGSIIVHLFRPETRAIYDLEAMWDSAPVKSLEKRRAAL